MTFWAGLIDLASAVVAVEYMDHGFQKRYGGLRRGILFVSAVIVYDIVMTLLNRWFPFEGLLGFFYGVMVFGYGMVALRGKWPEIMVKAFAWVFIALLGAYAVITVLGLVGGERVHEIFPLTGEELLLASLAALIVKFLLGRAVTALLCSRAKHNWTKSMGLAGLFLMITLFVMGLFVLELGGITGRMRAVITSALLLSITGFAVLLIELYQRLEAYRLKELESRIQKEQLEQQRARLREVGKIYHDMNGILLTLREMTSHQKYREVEDYLQKLSGELRRFPQFETTGNEGMDACLTRMVVCCQEKGILFSYRILCDLSAFDPIVLGRIVNNLFDNAVEACERLDGEAGVIDFCMLGHDGETEVLLKNSSTGSVLQEDPSLRTQKTDPEFHGYGLENVLEMIKENNGRYECWEEGKFFFQRILL